MMTARCPTCGAPMANTRAGVHLSPLKLRIFDAIHRAGPDGLAGEVLIREYGLPVSRQGLAVHVNQINAILASTPVSISGRGGYRLKRGSPPQPAEMFSLMALRARGML